ncbi:transposase [Actinosynnema sp. NPDC091369]
MSEFVLDRCEYPDELRTRVVRLYRASDPKPVIKRLAEQWGVHPEALRNGIRQDEADRGEWDDRPTATANRDSALPRRADDTRNDNPSDAGASTP